MSKENVLSGLVGVFIGVVLTWLLAPAWGGMAGYRNPVMGGYTSMMGGRSVVMVSGLLDRHFIEEMIPHHDGAIAMAQLALERSTRPEIHSLAQGIIEAQERENELMRGWYETWFGGDVPESGDGFGMGMMGSGMHMAGVEGDLDALRAATDFDLAFIEQMIPHHEMAIMMARMLAAGSERAELQELAGEIVTSQSREIQMMQSWYTSWSAQ